MYHLRKAAAVVLAAATVTACTAMGASADEYQKGDFNQDGVIDSNDALLTLHASIAPELLSYTEYNIADFNNDGSVDSDDALQILRTSVELAQTVTKTRTQVAEMKGWSARDVVEKVGPLFTEDQKKTGILASVSMAQFIVESGYGQSNIAIEANNCFGIKGWAEAQKRENSPWDGVSLYKVTTKEYDSRGNMYYSEANFRKYDCMEDSIEDHSRVLMYSTGDYGLRYAEVIGCTDYRRACQIIYDGGYCSDPGYVKLLCDVIEYWDLTQYDVQNYTPAVSFTTPSVTTTPDNTQTQHQTLYRVRASWDDAASQAGAFHIFDNAIECADLNPGYKVYDEDGNVVYEP